MLRAIKITMAALTLCLTINSLSSFKNVDDIDWYYNGPNNASDFTNPDYWQKTPVSGVTCGSTGTMPCHIVVDADDKTELGVVLSGYNSSTIFSIANRRS
ncbi:hypothetical protein SAMN05216436_102130 [bacterium A37T11]|nr:hypothetical protein SAMN05216436_102130 [bacterium A37T11]